MLFCLGPPKPGHGHQACRVRRGAQVLRLFRANTVRQGIAVLIHTSTRTGKALPSEDHPHRHGEKCDSEGRKGEEEGEEVHGATNRSLFRGQSGRKGEQAGKARRKIIPRIGSDRVFP